MADVSTLKTLYFYINPKFQTFAAILAKCIFPEQQSYGPFADMKYRSINFQILYSDYFYIIQIYLLNI